MYKKIRINFSLWVQGIDWSQIVHVVKVIIIVITVHLNFLILFFVSHVFIA